MSEPNDPTSQTPEETAFWQRAEDGKRIRDLEAALEHLVVLIGTKSTFTKTDRQVVELAVRAHGGIRNIFDEFPTEHGTEEVSSGVE